MLQIKKEEARSLLQKLRQVRQFAGEAIALLEHSIQLQGDDMEFFCHNPDDYLELIAKYAETEDRKMQQSRENCENVNGGDQS